MQHTDLQYVANYKTKTLILRLLKPLKHHDQLSAYANFLRKLAERF